MAFRSTTFAVLASAFSCGAYGDACPDIDSDSIAHSVIETAPACFEACPDLCGTLDKLANIYLDTFDFEAAMKAGCEEKAAFECIYPEETMKLCQPVLAQGADLGLDLPTSPKSFKATCAKLRPEGRGAAHVHHNDMQDEEDENENDTDISTTEQDVDAPQSSDTSSAYLSLGAVSFAVFSSFSS